MKKSLYFFIYELNVALFFYNVPNTDLVSRIIAWILFGGIPLVIFIIYLLSTKSDEILSRLESEKLKATQADFFPKDFVRNDNADRDINKFSYSPFLEKAYAVSKYIGFDDKELIIPDYYNGLPIVTISKNVFKNNKDLTKCVLSKNITTIGTEAFNKCVNLQIIENTENIRHAYKDAFKYDSYLRFSELPPHLNDIHKGAFSFCFIDNAIIRKVHFTIPGAFEYCKFGTMQLSMDIEEISENAFICIKVEKLIIPSSVRKIGKNAFWDVSIKKILIPNSVKEIEPGNFKSNKISRPLTMDGSPDMRYNGTLISVKTDTIIYCYPGSCAQDYARKNGLECHSYLEYS